MILVTGGTGFIGSHVCVELLEQRFEVAVLDNFSNSAPEVLTAIKSITGTRPALFEVDIRHSKKVRRVLNEIKPNAIIHLAGLKSVGESCECPDQYYDNNVTGSLSLLKAAITENVSSLIFSSSAMVYGNVDKHVIPETIWPKPANPYGRTKWMVEQIIEDSVFAVAGFKGLSLRYFNPVGAHPSGLIGEALSNQPNNLLPRVAQVALGIRDAIEILGSDYETPDGTGIRDYIHVQDLARGHVKALKYLFSAEGYHNLNLGAGRGYSVLEVIAAFESASGQVIKKRVSGRRPGDVERLVADVSKAGRLLDWKSQKGLEKMCQDAWRFSKNAHN